MKKSIFILLFLGLFPLFAADTVYKVDSLDAGKIKLPSGIEATADGFRMRNGKEGIVIPGSEKFRFAESGLTVMATLCMEKCGMNSSGTYADGSYVDNYHIIASKGREFVFGRRGDNWVDQLYFNFCVDGKWKVELNKTVPIPPYGKYFHAAVTLRRDFRPGDDRNHYIYQFYINGALKFSGDCRSDAITPTDAPVVIGRGEGMLNHQWCFPGVFDGVKIVNRALTEDEIAAEAILSRKVKISIPDRHFLSAEMIAQFERLSAMSAAPGKWGLASLRRAARDCYDLETVKKVLDKFPAFAGEKDFDRFAELWNQQAKPFAIVSAGDRVSLMLVTGKGKGAFPLLDMYDRKSNRGLFGSDTLKWQITASRLNGKKSVTENFSNFGSAWQTGDIRSVNGAKELDIFWQNGKVTVKSTMRFGNNRCDFTLSADNKDANLRLEELRFPVWSLKQLDASGEALIIPRMNGQRIADPLDNPNQIPAESGQPGSMMSMQFCGYRDDNTALYIGTEDPAAGARKFSVQPLTGELVISYRQAIAYNAGKKGGNPMEFSGKAAIEVVDGDWFEIGRAYRKFLEKDAPWYIKDLPRKATPKWMRDNILWLLISSGSKDGNLQVFMKDITELQKYIQLPMAIHFYGWNDKKDKGDWPNFYALDGSPAAVEELHKMGIRVLPYFDTLLWALNDGPGLKPKEFPTSGKASAYLQQDGQMILQSWGRPRRQYAIMCPAVPLWQKRMEFMCGYIMDNYGFDGIYHDQVAGNLARACYAENHPHLPGDPLAWNRGWKELFDLQDTIRLRHPEMVTTSEDANETHLRFFDGFLVWRWVYRNQIPLFNSLYSGRVQFVGRTYDQNRKGDPEDYFAKAASQMLYGEQLGWMIPVSLAKYPERRRFVKQMCHLRHELLEYFNCGEFSAPLKFKRPPAKKELFWGSPESLQKVATDNIMHSVYSLNGIKVMTFVNVTPDKETVSPLFELGKDEVIAVCDPALEQVLYVEAMPEVTLPGRGFAILLAGKKEALKDEADRLFAALKKIAAFDYGQNIFSSLPVKTLEVGVKEEFSGMFGRNLDPFSGEGCFVLTGSGKGRVLERFPLNGLERGKRYRVKMMIRADKGVSGAVLVGNTNENWNFVHFMILGGKVPSDGQWHEVSGEFTVEQRLFQPGIMFYNDSNGNYSVDDVIVEEIK
ncbi:MAG: hypothetical protein E7050_00130 [Lentisphaerae bacterium]|nr:hypothetical protein [Lentisphaerota bacterium]